MKWKTGLTTLDRFAEERKITRQAALNLLSKMKKEGFVAVHGGGREKRIYTLFDRPHQQTNGFYDLVNTYSPEKLQPRFEHYTRGRYTVEHAIIDGIRIGDVRTKEATMHLFSHIKDWKLLFSLAKKHGLTKDVKDLYQKARSSMKTRSMPGRYR